VLVTLAVIGIVYGALVAVVQPDVKKLVAYSSVSHLGFCVLGLFGLTTTAVTGSVYQMLNHGLSTGGLFLLVGMIYERRHTREIAAFGGLWKIVPAYSVALLLVMLASAGLPGLNGFVGEFLILVGSFRTLAVGDDGCDVRRRAGRALPPLDVPARDLRAGRARGEPWPPRPVGARARRHRAGDRALRAHGGLPHAVPFADRAVRREPGAALRAACSDDSRGAGGPGRASMTDIGTFVSGWQVALPAITALSAAFVVMFADLVMRGTERDGVAVVGALGLAATIAVALWQWVEPSAISGFQNTLRADRFALFFAVVVSLGAVFTVLMSIDYLRDHPLAGGDYYALVLLSTCA
jgi:formate hydrogenlyase subunit 3/multisubunit Na+/H+ antiporter MnhD subunit